MSNVTYGLEADTPLPPWDVQPEGVRITRVRAVVTAPEGVNLVAVVVETSEPGLVGYGCATFHQRARTVALAIEEYLDPFLRGRLVADITDIHEAMRLDPYWREGPVLNSAIAGVDIALWDIQGKRAGMPVWQLFGGRARAEVPVYVHATGDDEAGLIDAVARRVEQGYSIVRCQVGVPGAASYGARNVSGGHAWSPERYLDFVPRVLQSVRETFGAGLGLIHDVHERVPAAMVPVLLKALEPVGLFFAEDVVAPEDVGWLTRIRQLSPVPIALGELFVNRAQYLPVVLDRQVDFIRCHITAIGGLSEARRLAAVCEATGVRTAWHGPRDVSPIGHAAGLAIDLSSPAFGVHEHHEFSEAARTVFPGTPISKGGALGTWETPGLGVVLDESEARRHPPVPSAMNWPYARVRRSDGALQRP